LDVDVHAGVNVVKQIPADMVGILVDDEVIGAIPAPIGADGPVPGSDIEEKAAGEPETMMVGIEAFDAVSVGWAKMLEVAVFKRMVNVETLVVRAVVPIPMVVVDVGSAVHVAMVLPLGFGLRMRIIPLRRRRRDVALIRAGRVLTPVFVWRALSFAFVVLRKSRKSQENCQN
jgi:hypothetical protein